MDRTAPGTTATRNPLPNLQGWNNGDVSVTLGATDNLGGSGVQSIHYQLNGAENTALVIKPNPARVLITDEGTTTIAYSAIDNSDNIEPTKSLVVNIDKTLPVISGMPAPNYTLSPTKHQLITTTTIVTTDTLSNITTFAITTNSNEPDNETTNGDVPNDIIITNSTVQLRAERTPRGDNHVYTITTKATDLANNTTTTTTTYKIPR